ncbi:MAG TPA: ADOP family duplicated permease [Gemmatimonadales bacterium]|nr:ADOP family duplicated permease [Gemmatimonadales bacterium]
MNPPAAQFVQMMDTVLLDLRYAIRSLRRSPGFTALAVLTLGLGIGAATAGFAILHQVLLDPLPGVRDPGRLGMVVPAVRNGASFQPEALDADQRAEVLQSAPAVAAMAGIQIADVDVAVPEEPPQRLMVNFVSGEYFALLGASPAQGRPLGPDDDLPDGGTRVAVISDRLWQEGFGGRPDVVGQRLIVNGLSITVVGVAQPGFKGTERFEVPALWLPGNAYFDLNHYRAGFHRPATYPYTESVMRLRAGASWDQATNQLESAVRTLAETDTADFDPKVSANVFPGLGLSALGRDAIRRQVLLIIGIAGLVLLVTCANVANLLLFRRLQRQGDLVVRLVLGAGRARLVRFFLVESGLLGLASGAVGAGVALLLRALFGELRLLNFLKMGPVTLDIPVLAFAIVAGVIASLIAGLVPGVFGVRTDLNAHLKASGPTQAGGGRGLRVGLAVLQVAISLALVSGAYLVARTLRSYAEVPLGFDPAGVTMFEVEPKMLGYGEAQSHAYLRSLAQRVGGLPGVTRVALTSSAPMEFSMMDGVLPEASPGTPIEVWDIPVSGAYFATVGMPLLKGEVFGTADDWRDSSMKMGTAIVSLSLARQLFGDRDPVGELLKLRGGHGRSLRIIGVVGDVRSGRLSDAPRPAVYEPMGQGFDSPWMMLAVQGGAASATIIKEVQGAGRALDPSLPVESSGTLSDAVAAAVSSQTLLFKLVGSLSLFTLMLTAVGVYAIVAYGVTTRTREFGLRMALGADTPKLVRTALNPALVIVSGGVVAGVLGALYLTKFIAASLYGVSRFDPLAFITAALILALAVLLASWLPARRAAKIDPMVALRYE